MTTTKHPDAPLVRSRPRRADLRRSLVDAAAEILEESGPEALQARAVASGAGTSTQSLYTIFGGTPGLIEALVAEGFEQLTADLSGVVETADAVADHLSKGWMYCDWAFAHPQLYRLMYGLTGGALRPHAGIEMTVGGALANFPEGRAAVGVLIASVERVISSGRIRSDDPLLVAGQLLSATHGIVLLQISSAFGSSDEALRVMAELAVNLLVGLGDRRARAQRSLEAVIAVRLPELSRLS